MQKSFGLAGPPTFNTAVPSGDEGSYKTVSYIKDLIFDGTADPVVREEALLAVKGTAERDTTSQISSIHDWIRAKYKYVADPFHVETLHTARALILQTKRDRGFGMDCDDFVILESSMLRSIGIPTAIIIAACDKRRPNGWSHIYLTAYDARRGMWIPLDPTKKTRAAGWEPPNIYRKKVIKIGGMYDDGIPHMKDTRYSYTDRKHSRAGSPRGLSWFN